jgi:alpha-tubulin suppressor-like RCC1 family protein
MSSAQSKPTVIAIAAGSGHNLALQSDGMVWAWGSYSYAELGISNNTSPNICAGFYCIPTPVQVPGLSSVIAIAAGGTYSLALKSDDTVWAWGDISPPAQVWGLDHVTAIAAGGGHSLALKSDGTVWAWGSNSLGQLGEGRNIDADLAPVQVKGLSDVIAIAAGLIHSLAVKSDGTVWAWGDNSNGQLGRKPSTRPNTCTPDGCDLSPTPIQVDKLSDVKAIAAGGAHSLALKKDGTVRAWGLDTLGELGIGGSSDTCGPNGRVCTITPTKVDLSNILAVAAGGGHSLALKNDGTVWAWGANYAGQISTSFGMCTPEGSTRTISCSTTPVEVADPDGDILSGVMMIAAGEEHSLALKQDGTVWAWGSNVYGQLGIGSVTAPGKGPCGGIACSHKPVQVQGL